MGKTEKKILDKNAAKIKVQKSAYCGEMHIFHQLEDNELRNPVGWEKYDLATTILANEVKDEQHIEDSLKSLEVK